MSQERRKIWYWRDENFQGLKAIAQQLEAEPKLAHFKDYCLLRERGLRQEAFAALEKLFTAAKSWTIQERREFVGWIVKACRADGGRMSNLAPEPVWDRLIHPVLEEWKTQTPDDPVPFRLAGDMESLRVAVRLDPTDQETVLRLVDRLLGSVDMACHELPAGVIGETRQVLGDLQKVEELLKMLNGPGREELATIAAQYKEVVENYAEYCARANRTETFEGWAMALGRRCVGP